MAMDRQDVQNLDSCNALLAFASSRTRPHSDFPGTAYERDDGLIPIVDDSETEVLTLSLMAPITERLGSS